MRFVAEGRKIRSSSIGAWTRRRAVGMETREICKSREYIEDETTCKKHRGNSTNGMRWKRRFRTELTICEHLRRSRFVPTLYSRHGHRGIQHSLDGSKAKKFLACYSRLESLPPSFFFFWSLRPSWSSLHLPSDFLILLCRANPRWPHRISRCVCMQICARRSQRKSSRERTIVATADLTSISLRLLI